MYLKCFTNNRAYTVFSLFLHAAKQFVLPSQVRSDQGGENVMVARHMMEFRVPNRGSMIVGSSVHNQRIERLWHDFFSCVIKVYYRLFYFLEDRYLLYPSCPQHIYAVYYIYTPHINQSLREFCDG